MDKEPAAHTPTPLYTKTQECNCGAIEGLHLRCYGRKGKEFAWCEKLPVAVSKKCDCLIEVDDVDMTPGGIMTKYVIRYCPTHEQAAALQAENAELRKRLLLLEDVLWQAEEWRKEQETGMRDIYHDVNKNLLDALKRYQQALAKAEETI